MTMETATPSFEQLSDALLDLQQPMGKRTRAVFYLRTSGTKEDLKVLLTGEKTTTLKHEKTHNLIC